MEVGDHLGLGLRAGGARIRAAPSGPGGDEVAAVGAGQVRPGHAVRRRVLRPGGAPADRERQRHRARGRRPRLGDDRVPAVGQLDADAQPPQSRRGGPDQPVQLGAGERPVSPTTATRPGSAQRCARNRAYRSGSGQTPSAANGSSPSRADLALVLALVLARISGAPPARTVLSVLLVPTSAPRAL
ncbi:hypothetical protein [Actinomadura kijaniata]|uniref:hypothetical protein n=1 Tax=Actinomadura kijaniata TaxID=46161 RepID=UPI001C3F1C35|nr:hypothetical protein [Actinomadura kijaniata]